MAGVLLLTTAAYRPVLGYGPVSYDDPEYVVDNAAVKGGLDLATIGWALRSTEHANWHPLTWLSHALDWQLFGARWGAHHGTSLALHLATVVAVYLALRRLTGAAWRSLAVAAVFAVHPVNVQSVAWLSERKNVLSGLLFAATLAAYAAHARRPTAIRFAAVTLLFGLGLMAKPMLVTLPLLLLLLDVWPLRRIPSPGARAAVLEKLPWLAMSAAESLVTLRAQQWARPSLQAWPMAVRLCSSLGAYLGYLEKTFWPFDFAVLYPAPADPCRALPIGAAAGVLAAVTAAAVLAFRRWPYVLVGWSWFVGLLVPVIGLVQVGDQLMADRYLYLPLLGLVMAVVWTVGGLVRRSMAAARAIAVLFAVAVSGLAWRTSIEVRYWRDSATLFSRALSVTGPSCIVENDLAVEVKRQGDRPRAWRLLTQAMEHCPALAVAHTNLAVMLTEGGDPAAAFPHFVAAARLDPRDAAAQYNLGLALLYQGRTPEAIAFFRRALEADPSHQPSWAILRRMLTDPARRAPRID